MSRERAPESPNRADEPTTQVTRADLENIGRISALLTALNDPKAGADVLARHVEAIPVLRERIALQFAQRMTSRGRAAVATQIAILGNRVLESILLDLLEDIVVLHSETQIVAASSR